MIYHQKFYDYFLIKYTMHCTKLSSVKRKLALPRIAVLCLAAVAFIFTGIKVTEQEKRVVVNAMTAAADSLRMQVKNDTDILKNYSYGSKYPKKNQLHINYIKSIFNFTLLSVIAKKHGLLLSF